MKRLMITRREFLRQIMAVGVIYCSELPFANVLNASNGFDNGIIDVHHHILPSIYTSSLAEIGITSANGHPFPAWNAQRSIEAMDRNGIQTAITSVSAPGIYFGDTEWTKRLARDCNEYSAGLIAKYPGRFGCFAVLPLPDVEGSLAEISHALDELDLDGFILLSNIGGEYLGSPGFEDVFAELNRRKAVVFIHPTEPFGKQYPKMQIPPSFFEFVFDTTRTVASLIQHNTFERFPEITFIVAHGGGAAPYLSKKMALTAQISGLQSKQTNSQLQKLYYDTSLSTSRYPLGLLKELAGAHKIVFGSDFGFAPEYVLASSLYELEHSEVFAESELQKIYKYNALQLFSRVHE